MHCNYCYVSSLVNLNVCVFLFNMKIGSKSKNNVLQKLKKGKNMMKPIKKEKREKELI